MQDNMYDGYSDDDVYDGYSEDGCNDDVYEGYSEDKEVKEIKGITDTVTDYTYTDLSYPCIIFKKGIKLERHKVQVISNMVKSTTQGIVKDIALYFSNADQLYKLGNINGFQVSPIIDIAGRENLIAYLDKNTRLDDSLIYTLCSI